MNNKAKNSQRWYFAWENLRQGFCCIFISFLIFICRFSSFTFCFSTSSLTLPWTIAEVFTPHFILSAQPIAEWFATLSFSTIPLSSYGECYDFEWAFFTLRSFIDIFDSTCVYQGLPGRRQFFLKFAGLRTDPRNTNPAYLFVWFTVIHKSFIWLLFYLSFMAARICEESAPREIRTLSTIGLACWKAFCFIRSATKLDT